MAIDLSQEMTVIAGATKIYEYYSRDSAGNPIDISSHLLTLTVKKDYGATTETLFTCTNGDGFEILDGPGGYARLTILPSKTTELNIVPGEDRLTGFFVMTRTVNDELVDKARGVFNLIASR